MTRVSPGQWSLQPEAELDADDIDKGNNANSAGW